MAKGQFVNDTFEQLAELGVSTAKTAGSQIKQTFDPLAIIEQVIGIQNPSSDKGVEQIEQNKSPKKKHTPLDFTKLQGKYADQDKVKQEALKNRLFQLIKSEDDKLLQKKKQEEAQKKQQVAYEEYEKKQKEKEKEQAQQSSSAPQGKQRRTLFSPKKMAQRNVAETKPSTGKQ